MNVAATTKSMSTRQRQQEIKAKGSADMKASTLLPEWEVLNYFVVVVVVE